MVRAGCEGTIGLLFKRAIEIAYQVTHIYEKLSKLFKHVPGLPDFWSDLAEDEIGHVTTLQDIRLL